MKPRRAAFGGRLKRRVGRLLPLKIYRLACLVSYISEASNTRFLYVHGRQRTTVGPYRGTITA
jgi:hypothetical protein